MHRAVRGAADQRSALPDGSHGPAAGQCGPSLVRADRRGNVVPHSYGPTAGATWSRIRTGRPSGQHGPSFVRADRRGDVVPHSHGSTAGATWSRIRTGRPPGRRGPAFVEPIVGRLLFVPAPRSPMNAPRRARCSRPTVGSTGSFSRADRPGNVVPHSHGSTAGATWSRIRTGRPPGRRGPSFVEPTVGRLLFVPASRSPMNAPRPARCSRPTVGSTGVSSRSAPRRTRPAPSTRAWPRVRCTGTPADCWRPIRRSSAPRRCNW